MGVCGDYGPLDIQSPCIRTAWSAFVPAAVVFLICFSAIPVPKLLQPIFAFIGAPFKLYIDLHEAEALDIAAVAAEKEEDVVAEVEVPSFVPLWRTLVFVFIGIAESLCWVADGSYRLYNGLYSPWTAAFSFIFALTWLYTVVRPIARPTPTAPLDLFTIYLLLFFAGCVQFGGFWYDHTALGLPWPSTLSCVALGANITALIVLLVATVTMPLAIPSSRVDKTEIVGGLLYKISQISSFDRAVLSLRRTTLHCGDGCPLLGSSHWSIADATRR